MKHYRGIEAKIMPYSNRFTNHVKLTDRRNNKSVYIDAVDSINTTLDSAENWLKNKGFNIIGYAELKESYIILVDNWGNDFIELKK